MVRALFARVLNFDRRSREQSAQRHFEHTCLVAAHSQKAPMPQKSVVVLPSRNSGARRSHTKALHSRRLRRFQRIT